MRILLSCLFLLLASSATADRVVPSDRVVNSVTVRAEPRTGSGADVLGALRPGESAELLSSTARHWRRVRLDNGTEGFVSKSWTRVVPDVPPTTQNLEIHFIDVGQGDSTLIICPNGNTILVDVGSVGGGDADAIRDYILEQLDTERRINDLVITHPDRDHYNLIESTLAGVAVDHVLWVGEIEDHTQANFDDWLRDTTNKTNLDSTDFDPFNNPSDQLACGDADVFVLSAEETSGRASWRKNTMSIVLMIRYGEFEAVLTGDATTVTENVILDRYTAAWLDVDVLKTGHHGSSTTSTGPNWATTLSPEVAVVSAGNRSQHGHPRQIVVERLEPRTNEVAVHPISYSSGSRPNYQWTDEQNYTEAIYSTATSGNVVITTDGQGTYDVRSEHHGE
jgi:beta-lactamase superfamily II metal-dependent hydrolase